MKKSQEFINPITDNWMTDYVWNKNVVVSIQSQSNMPLVACIMHTYCVGFETCVCNGNHLWIRFSIVQFCYEGYDRSV